MEMNVVMVDDLEVDVDIEGSGLLDNENFLFEGEQLIFVDK